MTIVNPTADWRDLPVDQVTIEDLMPMPLSIADLRPVQHIPPIPLCKQKKPCVPEPATFMLLLVGIMCLVLFRRVR